MRLLERAVQCVYVRLNRCNATNPFDKISTSADPAISSGYAIYESFKKVYKMQILIGSTLKTLMSILLPVHRDPHHLVVHVIYEFQK